MRYDKVLIVMMLLLLLCSTAFLTGCKHTEAVQSKTLSKVRPWPATPEKPRMQSDVAEYIVQGKSAYDSCTGTLDILMTPAPVND